MRFCREAIEIRQPVFDQALTYARGTGQVLDRVVIIEEHRMRQFPDIVETPLRPRFCFLSHGFLHSGPVRRRGSGDDPAEQTQENESCCDARGPVAPQEFDR